MPDTQTACPLLPCLLPPRVGDEQREMPVLLKTAFLLGTTLALAVAMLPVQAQTPPAPVVAIQAAIQNYPKQIHSLSCDLTTTTTIGDTFLQSNENAGVTIPQVQVEQGEWAFKDDKVINKSKYIEGDPAPAGHDMDSVYLYNGSGSYYIHSENGGSATRSVSGNRHHQTKANGYWSPLQFSYKLDAQWLSDVLSSTNPTLERVGTDPAFGQLYVIHLNLRGREERIWFAPKYGNIAVKIVDDGPRPDQRAIYTSSHYEHFGKFWLPLQGDYRILTKQPNGQATVQFEKKFVFSDIQVNNVPDSTFDFQWPTGASLYDNDVRTKYFRSASGKWVAIDFGETPVPSPRRLSAAAVVPWILFVCLAALFLFGFFRRRRRASV